MSTRGSKRQKVADDGVATKTPHVQTGDGSTPRRGVPSRVAGIHTVLAGIILKTRFFG